MATAALEYQRREQAFRDFCNLEAEGIVPNPNALYEHYIALNRSNPELRGTIPTTNRSTVYEWSREDRWKERYAEMKREQSDIAAEKYEVIRTQTYGRLVSFQKDALDTILELARESRDQKVRLQAAESILDRTGLGKIQARPQRGEAGEKPGAEEAEALPADASESDIVKWLSLNSGSNLNA